MHPSRGVGIVLVACAAAAAVPASAARQGGLDAFTSKATEACKPKTLTPVVAHDARYAPVSSAAAAPRSRRGVPLTITGTVSGLACGPIAGAAIEFWQTDGTGQTVIRARETTDATGHFRLDTVVPGARPGAARRIGAHVTVPGKADLWTALFFADDAAARTDPAFKPELALQTTGTAAARSATFDFVLNL